MNTTMLSATPKVVASTAPGMSLSHEMRASLLEETVKQYKEEGNEKIYELISHYFQLEEEEFVIHRLQGHLEICADIIPFFSDGPDAFRDKFISFWQNMGITSALIVAIAVSILLNQCRKLLSMNQLQLPSM